MGRPAGMRERIQQVALELFNAQGYDKTSLREIAERLGVTKAALYYHFKTKDDLIENVVNGYITDLDELIAWGRQQPVGLETRKELLRRYSEIVKVSGGMIKFVHANQVTLQQLKFGDTFRDHMRALHELMHDPSATVAQNLRNSLAVVSTHIGQVFFAEIYPDKDLEPALREVSQDLLERS